MGWSDAVKIIEASLPQVRHNFELMRELENKMAEKGISLPPKPWFLKEAERILLDTADKR